VHVTVSIPQEPPNKISRVLGQFCGGASIFEISKDIPKNTKENIPSDHFCSHLRQEGQIDLIPSPDCCICIAFSENTHNCHL
jgi:hypothetical protein